MVMNKKRLIIVFAAVLVSFVSTMVLPVLADEAEALTPEQQAQNDALINEAVEHYSGRRYEEAIALFKQANDIQEEPELLYNIARSYERLSQSDEALEWYQRFLEMPGTTGELRTKALKNIAALRKEISAQEAIRQAAETNADAESKTMASPVPPPPVFPDDTTTSSEKNSTQASSHKVISIMLIGSGVAAMIAGGIFGGLALAAKNDYESAAFDADRLQYRDDMSRNALIFDIVFSSGAVLATVGISLFIVDGIRRTPEKALTAGQRHKGNGARPGVIEIMPSVAIGNRNMAFGLSGQF
jgi:tetratricopeptide (TPR) repeat protein